MGFATGAAISFPAFSSGSFDFLPPELFPCKENKSFMLANDVLAMICYGQNRNVASSKNAKKKAEVKMSMFVDVGHLLRQSWRRFPILSFVFRRCLFVRFLFLAVVINIIPVGGALVAFALFLLFIAIIFILRCSAFQKSFC